MLDRNKAEEILHYFNIDSEIDSLYGNWAVAKNGDVVNYLYSYVIPSIHLYDEDWMWKLRGKIWFRPECENCLKEALNRANSLLENK